MSYDYLIVGAGLFGSIFAYEMQKRGKKCIVIDKRNHIGGNCWSEKIEGIECHKYGPHVFHTSNKSIWDYVNKITDFYNFYYKVKVKYRNSIYSFPINLLTLHQIFGVSSPQEAKAKIDFLRTNLPETDVEAKISNKIGILLCKIFFKGYSEKQWGRPLSSLHEDIIKRIPIRFDFNDDYYDTENLYQGLPKGGYQPFFNNLLKNTKVLCNTDFYSDRNHWYNSAKKIIFTGKIDEYFDYSLGKLEYRGLNFEWEVHDIEDFQGSVAINYADPEIPYTRIVEHKHFNTSEHFNHTVISYEIPYEAGINDIPYYPVNDTKNNELYNRYREMADLDRKVIFCGRCGYFKYLNMNEIVENALELVEKEIILNQN